MVVFVLTFFEQLSHESASVRAAAVLCCSSSLRASLDAAVALATTMLRDSHVVVRRAAIRAVESNGASGIASSFFLTLAHVLRHESDAVVRVGAARCLWHCARVATDEILRAAFVKLCDCVINDASVDVRATCCRLLGEFGTIPLALVMQCFDKKLNAAASDAPPPVASGGPLQIEGDIDVLLDDKRAVELASAAGAFVHGLEDEFAAVRGAAVDSITKLALHWPTRELAERATTNLVDAFNDEIESVRLRAVLGVRRILHTTRSTAGEQLALSEDYVIVALSNLEEASEQIRGAIRALLCSVRLESAQSLRAIVQSLMQNTTKHPEDTPSVLQCLRRLGRGHAEFAEQLVEKLLHIDRRFAPQEPHIDDLYYACIMVLLVNAAVRRPTILARLPSYCAGHAAYLRLRFGALMPTVATLTAGASRLIESTPPPPPPPGSDEGAVPVDIDIDTQCGAAAASSFVALVRTSIASLGDKTHRVALLGNAVVDLQRIASARVANATDDASANVRRRCGWLSELFACIRDAIVLCDERLSNTGDAATRGARLQRACQRLRHAFAGVGTVIDDTMDTIDCLGACWSLLGRCTAVLDAALAIGGHTAPGTADLANQVQTLVQLISNKRVSLGATPQILIEAARAESGDAALVAAKLIPVLQGIAGRYDATTHDAELRRAIEVDDIVRKSVHFSKPAQLVANLDARVAFRSAADAHADSAMVDNVNGDEDGDDNVEDDDDDDGADIGGATIADDAVLAVRRARSLLPAPTRSLDGLALGNGSGGGALFFTDLVGSARRPVLFHRRLPLRLDLAGVVHHVGDSAGRLAVQVTLLPLRLGVAAMSANAFVHTQPLEAQHCAAVAHDERSIRFACHLALPVAPLMRAAEQAAVAAQQASLDDSASAARKSPPVVALRICIVHRVHSTLDVELGEPALMFITPR